MRRDCSEVARIVLYSGMKLHTKRFKLEFTDLILKQLPKLEKRLRFPFSHSENQNTQCDSPVFLFVKHRLQYFNPNSFIKTNDLRLN